MARAPRRSRPRTAIRVAPESRVEPTDADALTRRVGERLHALRRARGYSLDQLAALTGVSKGTLSQIEGGNTNPTLAVLWRIADGLGLPFSSLLGADGSERAVVVRKADVAPIRANGGAFESRLLSPGRALGDVELYELRLAPRAAHDAEPHAPGTRESVVVLAGVLRVRVGDGSHDLAAGDALSFVADVPHRYENPGRAEARCHNVIVYGRR